MRDSPEAGGLSLVKPRVLESRSLPS